MAVSTTSDHEQPSDTIVGALVEAHARFQPELVRRCQRIVGDRAQAEDLAQEAFARALERQRDLDPDRPIDAWLTTVATRLAIDTLRRGRRFGGAPADIPDVDLTFDAAADQERRRHVRAAIDQLSDRQRQAVVLYSFHDLSYDEIADREGLSLGAVKMTLMRARRRLRDALAGKDLLGAVPGLAALRRVFPTSTRPPWGWRRRTLGPAGGVAAGLGVVGLALAAPSGGPTIHVQADIVHPVEVGEDGDGEGGPASTPQAGGAFLRKADCARVRLIMDSPTNDGPVGGDFDPDGVSLPPPVLPGSTDEPTPPPDGEEGATPPGSPHRANPGDGEAGGGQVGGSGVDSREANEGGGLAETGHGDGPQAGEAVASAGDSPRLCSR